MQHARCALKSVRQLSGMICFEAKRFFTNPSGLGQYERWLVQNLLLHLTEFEFLLLKPAGRTPVSAGDFPEIRIREYRNMLGINRSIFLERYLPKHSVLHGLSNELPFHSEREIRARIVTIHDVLFRDRPQDYAPIDRMIYHIKAKNAIAKADAIIAISEWTKTKLIQYYGADENKLRVVYQNCDSGFYRSVPEEEKRHLKTVYGLPESFALVVSAFTPRKNHRILPEMLLAMPKSDRMPIVLIGEGAEKKPLRNQISRLKLEKYFIFLKNINNQTLAALAQMARLMIYPSLMEGFGRPILEAFASGVPLICHNEGAIKEIAANAAYTVDCRDAGQMAAAAHDLICHEDKAAGFLQAARKRLCDFETPKIMAQYRRLYSAFSI